MYQQGDDDDGSGVDSVEQRYEPAVEMAGRSYDLHVLRRQGTLVSKDTPHLSTSSNINELADVNELTPLLKTGAPLPLGLPTSRICFPGQKKVT